MNFKSLISRVLRRIGTALPAKKQEADRDKTGMDLNNSTSLALLCRNSDEATLKERKAFLRNLKGEYGIKKVLIYAFSEEEIENVPIYLGHFKELDFFCLNDVSWRLVPKNSIASFCENNFDILIDLSTEESEPLEHILARSKAKMKVGRKGSVHEKYLDVIIDVPQDESERSFLKETEYFLSNFSFN